MRRKQGRERPEWLKLKSIIEKQCTLDEYQTNIQTDRQKARHTYKQI